MQRARRDGEVGDGRWRGGGILRPIPISAGAALASHGLVQQEVEQEVEGDAEEDTQEHITNVLCKGLAGGETGGGAGGEAEEQARK